MTEGSFVAIQCINKQNSTVECIFLDDAIRGLMDDISGGDMY